MGFGLTEMCLRVPARVSGSETYAAVAGPSPPTLLESERRFGSGAPKPASLCRGDALRGREIASTADRDSNLQAAAHTGDVFAWPGLFTPAKRERKKAAAAPRKGRGGAALRARQEVAEQVAAFCTRVPAARVAPTRGELDLLWASCAAHDPADVADALSEQLTWANGCPDWQPRLRALHVLQHLRLGADGRGREVAAAVLADVEASLLHLAQEVAECSALAARLLKPPGGAEGPPPCEPEARAAQVPRSRSVSERFWGVELGGHPARREAEGDDGELLFGLSDCGPDADTVPVPHAAPRATRPPALVMSLEDTVAPVQPPPLPEVPCAGSSELPAAHGLPDDLVFPHTHTPVGTQEDMPQAPTPCPQVQKLDRPSDLGYHWLEKSAVEAATPARADPFASLTAQMKNMMLQEGEGL